MIGKLIIDAFFIMVEIKIDKQIGAQIGTDEKGLPVVGFSLATVENIFDEHKEEQDFKFNIRCAGGSVYEGLKIYDFLRSSGKNIYMNAETECHSIAVILLLAAPFENRTANQNATALIHEVQSPDVGGAMTNTELKQLSETVDSAQKRILSIYADRTGKPVEALSELMKKEKRNDVSILLEYKFISSINNYNTNLNKRMSDLKSIKSKAMDLVNQVTEALKSKEDLANYDFLDAEGNAMFSVEGEAEALALESSVSFPEGAETSGTFILEDGKTVTIAEGKVTAIEEPSNEDEPSKEELANQVEELTAEVTNLKSLLNESKDAITELSNHVKSEGKPAPRRSAGRVELGAPVKTAAEIKNEANEKRKLAKSNKKKGELN